MTAVTQRRAQQMSVIALVAALHAAFFWVLLLKTENRLAAVPESASLTLLYLTPDPVEVIRLPPVRPSAPIARLSVETPLTLQPSDLAPSVPARGEESNAIHLSIDWTSELNRAAEKVTSEAPQVKPREFGASHVAPSPAAKSPEFAWKRSHTNRLERVTEGTAIHLGQHCVMSLTPLPVFSCTPGKEQANGDLFEHMHDASQEGEGSRLP